MALSVITRGFGSFSLTHFVVTRGYGSGTLGTHALYAKHSGQWQAAIPYVNVRGTWVTTTFVYGKHGGIWQQVYP